MSPATRVSESGAARVTRCRRGTPGRRPVGSVLLLALLAGCAGERGETTNEEPAEPEAPPRVALETSAGRIVLELYPDRTPETVENFMLHVRSGFYDGLVFHRVEEDFVIQAGRITADGAERTTSVYPLANEAAHGGRNVRGAVAMARTGDPHSATSEFFINLTDNPELDFQDSTATGWGYAVFGQVIEGIEVVDRIGAGATRPRGRHRSFPVDPVVIERATIVEQ